MRFPRTKDSGGSVSTLPGAGAPAPTGFDALLQSGAPTATVPATAGATTGAAASAGPAPIRSRLARLAGGVDRTGRRRGTARNVQKIMNVLGVLVIGLGIAVVVLGWYGASHSPYLYQEVPYLISGGLLGVAMVVAGAAVFLGSWSLRQVQETRRDTQMIVRAIERLERSVRDERAAGQPAERAGQRDAAVAAEAAAGPGGR